MGAAGVRIQGSDCEKLTDIFYGNCCKIGLLPIVLSEPDIEELHAPVASDSGLTLEVDLIERWVKVFNGNIFRFSIDEVVGQDFLNGMDDVSATLSRVDEIRQFEAQHIARRRWI